MIIPQGPSVVLELNQSTDSAYWGHHMYVYQFCHAILQSWCVNFGSLTFSASTKLGSPRSNFCGSTQSLFRVRLFTSLKSTSHAVWCTQKLKCRLYSRPIPPTTDNLDKARKLCLSNEENLAQTWQSSDSLIGGKLNHQNQVGMKLVPTILTLSLVGNYIRTVRE